MNPIKSTLAAGALAMFLATLLGAIGAHALRPMLEESGHLHTWETAVLYQLAHGLALLAAGIWLSVRDAAARPRNLALCGKLWLAGIVLFSGSLYILSLGGPRWVGPVTPAGGLCFLAGWMILAVGILRVKSAANPTT
jgi:uncharacterized membrane protein YgdD (TMEM256/DUF423 family)